MLTSRSSCLLAAATWTLAIAIIDRQEPIALVCLSVIVWLWLEWIWFQSLKLSSQPFLSNCRRLIDGHDDRLVTMVTDQVYQIEFSGELVARTRGYRLLVQDNVPDTFEIVDGRTWVVIDSRRNPRFVCTYSVRAAVCGKLSLPGIQVEITDYWGFFRTQQFVALEQLPTILPFLIRPQTTVSVLKHNNLQRHIGHHRHRSAGVSSELLGIRDYRVGDPPRTIAWKPTARLGKLMTCEFENEVPIRATLFVDLAAYQFQGRPGASAADRAIMACAAIAKLLLADKDPVAAVLLKNTPTGGLRIENSGPTIKRIDHGSGERQLTRLLQYLLAASNPNPPLDHFPIHHLVRIVFENSSRRFPELFDEQFNRGPVKRRWLRFREIDNDRIRRATAIVLEHLLGLEFGISTRMQFDDHCMRDACLRYVRKYSVVSGSTSIPLDPPWLRPDQWRRESQRMTHFLCESLLEARTRAKDNELFVLIAPQPIDQQGVEAVESTVKTLVAARHRVIFVAPQIPSNQQQILDPTARRIMAAARHAQSEEGYASTSARLGYDTEHELRMGLTSIGVAYARIDDPSLMQIVATEVGLLQSGKSRGKVLRRR